MDQNSKSQRKSETASSQKDMILIGLGSSLPYRRLQPREIILSARSALERVVGPIKLSRLYVSPAWPDPADPPFVNAVALAEANLGSADAVLAALQAIEAGYGRRRERRHGPRTLDLDLLDFNGEIRSPGLTGGLTLPHPGIAARDFVLAPLCEVAPQWRHPASRATAADMLSRLAVRIAAPLA